MSKKRKSSAKKRILTALVAVQAVLLAILMIGACLEKFVFSGFYYDPDDYEPLTDEELASIQAGDPNETIDPDATVVDPDRVDWGETEIIDSAEYVYNFLLVGQDRRPGEKRARSDTMILVTVNTESKEITMTSIMRDMYVQIPGYKDNRINVPYAINGAELLFDTIETNLGLRPDYFVEVDFNGFVEIIDILGGVDVELTEAEAVHLNNNERKYGFPNDSWALRTGMNHLNGKQALSYARIRSVDGTGDFGRTQRQRNVLTALANKAASLDVFKLKDLVGAMTNCITTDMKSAEMLSFVVKFYPVLTEGKIASQRIPADGTYYFATVPDVGSVLIPDLEKNRDVLAQIQQ